MKIEEMNIYQKLLKISDEISPLLKDMEVGKGYNSYKAISEAKVKEIVKPLEMKYGVYSYPYNSEELQAEVLESESVYEDTNKGTVKTDVKSRFVLRVKVYFKFVNVDNPSEFVDMISYGDGVDSLDKAPGKAMTYSFKTALINAYKIISGDDPDQFHSKDNEITKTKTTQTQETSPLQDAKISLAQKDKITKGIEDGKINLDGIKSHYKVKSVDELNYAQAEEIIKLKFKKKDEAENII